MGVTVRAQDGASWIFVNHQGKRKAKRVGAGKPDKTAEKIQAKLVLGGLSILARHQAQPPRNQPA